jgi:hypothetical protein
MNITYGFEDFFLSGKRAEARNPTLYDKVGKQRPALSVPPD